jgi:hypothetical protein
MPPSSWRSARPNYSPPCHTLARTPDGRTPTARSRPPDQRPEASSGRFGLRPHSPCLGRAAGHVRRRRAERGPRPPALAGPRHDRHTLPHPAAPARPRRPEPQDRRRPHRLPGDQRRGGQADGPARPRPLDPDRPGRRGSIAADGPLRGGDDRLDRGSRTTPSPRWPRSWPPPPTWPTGRRSPGCSLWWPGPRPCCWPARPRRPGWSGSSS